MVLKEKTCRKRKIPVDCQPSHQCHICGRFYPLGRSFNCHVKIHYSIKPFACKVCGRRFAHHANCLQHQLTHRTKFKCPSCEKNYRNKVFLSRHLKHKHGIFQHASKSDEQTRPDRRNIRSFFQQDFSKNEQSTSNKCDFIEKEPNDNVSLVTQSSNFKDSALIKTEPADIFQFPISPSAIKTETDFPPDTVHNSVDFQTQTPNKYSSNGVVRQSEMLTPCGNSLSAGNNVTRSCDSGDGLAENAGNLGNNLLAVSKQDPSCVVPNSGSLSAISSCKDDNILSTGNHGNDMSTHISNSVLVIPLDSSISDDSNCENVLRALKDFVNLDIESEDKIPVVQSAIHSTFSDRKNSKAKQIASMSVQNCESENVPNIIVPSSIQNSHRLKSYCSELKYSPQEDLDCNHGNSGPYESQKLSHGTSCRHLVNNSNKQPNPALMVNNIPHRSSIKKLLELTAKNLERKRQDRKSFDVDKIGPNGKQCEVTKQVPFPPVLHNTQATTIHPFIQNPIQSNTQTQGLRRLCVQPSNTQTQGPPIISVHPSNTQTQGPPISGVKQSNTQSQGTPIMCVQPSNTQRGGPPRRFVQQPNTNSMGPPILYVQPSNTQSQGPPILCVQPSNTQTQGLPRGFVPQPNTQTQGPPIMCVQPSYTQMQGPPRLYVQPNTQTQGISKLCVQQPNTQINDPPRLCVQPSYSQWQGPQQLCVVDFGRYHGYKLGDVVSSLDVDQADGLNSDQIVSTGSHDNSVIDNNHDNRAQVSTIHRINENIASNSSRGIDERNLSAINHSNIVQNQSNNLPVKNFGGKYNLGIPDSGVTVIKHGGGVSIVSHSPSAAKTFDNLVVAENKVVSPSKPSPQQQLNPEPSIMIMSSPNYQLIPEPFTLSTSKHQLTSLQQSNMASKQRLMPQCSTMASQHQQSMPQCSTMASQHQQSSGQCSTMASQHQQSSGQCSTMASQHQQSSGQCSTMASEHQQSSGQCSTMASQHQQSSGQCSTMASQHQQSSGQCSTMASQHQQSMPQCSTMASQHQQSSGQCSNMASQHQQSIPQCLTMASQHQQSSSVCSTMASHNQEMNPRPSTMASQPNLKQPSPQRSTILSKNCDQSKQTVCDFLCEICGESFSLRHKYQLHVIMHEVPSMKHQSTVPQPSDKDTQEKNHRSSFDNQDEPSAPDIQQSPAFETLCEICGEHFTMRHKYQLHVIMHEIPLFKTPTRTVPRNSIENGRPSIPQPSVQGHLQGNCQSDIQKVIQEMKINEPRVLLKRIRLEDSNTYQNRIKKAKQEMQMNDPKVLSERISLNEGKQQSEIKTNKEIKLKEVRVLLKRLS